MSEVNWRESMDRIPDRIDSRFRYILLAAQRAEQLLKGGTPKIETTETKPTRVAMNEISTDLIAWDYGPAPEVDEVEEAPAET